MAISRYFSQGNLSLNNTGHGYPWPFEWSQGEIMIIQAIAIKNHRRESVI